MHFRYIQIGTGKKESRSFPAGRVKDGKSEDNAPGYAGRVDFSAKWRHALRGMDYAILVINGADGVQGHAIAARDCSKISNAPTFIFVTRWIRWEQMSKGTGRSAEQTG